MSAFSSCSMNNKRIITKINEENYIDSREKEIFEALADCDKKSILNMFSENAKKQATDMENNLDALLMCFKGKEFTYEQKNWSSNELTDEGKKRLQIVTRYTIVVDNTTYKCYIIDYPVDMIDDNNRGVYTFCVISSDIELYWQDLAPGAYFLN